MRTWTITALLPGPDDNRVSTDFSRSEADGYGIEFEDGWLHVKKSDDSGEVVAATSFPREQVLLVRTQWSS